MIGASSDAPKGSNMSENREHQEFPELDRKEHAASHQEKSWEAWHRTDDVLL